MHYERLSAGKRYKLLPADVHYKRLPAERRDVFLFARVLPYIVVPHVACVHGCAFVFVISAQTARLVAHACAGGSQRRAEGEQW